MRICQLLVVLGARKYNIHVLSATVYACFKFPCRDAGQKSEGEERQRDSQRQRHKETDRDERDRAFKGPHCTKIQTHNNTIISTSTSCSKGKEKSGIQRARRRGSRPSLKMSHFLQQGHTHSSKATAPHRATTLGQAYSNPT